MNEAKSCLIYAEVFAKNILNNQSKNIMNITFHLAINVNDIEKSNQRFIVKFWVVNWVIMRRKVARRELLGE